MWRDKTCESLQVTLNNWSVWVKVWMVNATSWRVFCFFSAGEGWGGGCPAPYWFDTWEHFEWTVIQLFTNNTHTPKKKKTRNIWVESKACSLSCVHSYQRTKPWYTAKVMCVLHGKCFGLSPITLPPFCRAIALLSHCEMSGRSVEMPERIWVQRCRGETWH